MSFRRHRTSLAAAALAVAALAGAPAAGLAAASNTGSGGSGLSGDGNSGDGSRSNSGAALTQPGNGQLTASANGITITTHAAGVLGGRMTVTGTVSHVPAGTRVEIQRSGRQTANRWADTTHAFTNASGNFTAVWPVNHIGRFQIRAVPAASPNARAASHGSAGAASDPSPTVTVTVYREAIATYYGPGSWGSRTACGQTLTRHMLGVANRTLPCGTPVQILYRGRTIVVPVIDRGPYANGADWDLTEATANALGMDGTARIGAVSLPRH